MFGYSVTDFDKAAEGTSGYIININITPLLLTNVKSVQAQVKDDDTPEPELSGVDEDALYSYLNDDACPDIAFCSVGRRCGIFFKTAVFDYVDQTRIKLQGQRQSQDCVYDADNLDVPDQDYMYLVYLTLRAISQYPSDSLKYNIEAEELRIQNE